MHPQLLRPKSLQITKDNGAVPACADKLFSLCGATGIKCLTRGESL